jgi:hypothetical protein
MAIKAICTDESDTVHLLIGLNRENIDSLLRGEVVTLPRGGVALSEKSDIAILFAETDGELEKKLPPKTPSA